MIMAMVVSGSNHSEPVYILPAVLLTFALLLLTTDYHTVHTFSFVPYLTVPFISLPYLIYLPLPFNSLPYFILPCQTSSK